MSNNDPSNYAGQDYIDLGFIGALQGAMAPMYNEPEVAMQIRHALMECHWLTHKSSAHTYNVFIRLDGDRMTAIVSSPINPDIEDPTKPQEEA